jgi:farnesyl diphosphate synthase
MPHFRAHLEATAKTVDAALDRFLTPQWLGAERGGMPCPDRLLEATRYTVLGGGKRFRPFLAIESARLFGHDGAEVMQAACAFELLHCYSLVHDDLPAMDDDDLRRGKPTVHKAYDEATAILVGDGLCTLAFEMMAALPDEVPAERRLKLTLTLAVASGFQGMVGGQYLDLNPGPSATPDAVRRLQQMKTGALIKAACLTGPLISGAGETDVARLETYGRIVGEAFQLADDLLDLEGTEEAVGKRVGKDHAAGKATLATINGVEAARERLTQLVAAAGETLAPYGDRADTLIAAARFVASRTF